MIEAGRALALRVEHALDAGQPLEQPLDLGDALGLADVDVRDLVVGDRERLRGAGVEQLAPELAGGPRAASPRAARG